MSFGNQPHQVIQAVHMSVPPQLTDSKMIIKNLMLVSTIVVWSLSGAVPACSFYSSYCQLFPILLVAKWIQRAAGQRDLPTQKCQANLLRLRDWINQGSRLRLSNFDREFTVKNAGVTVAYQHKCTGPSYQRLWVLHVSNWHAAVWCLDVKIQWLLVFIRTP